ncbi:TonB-dependent receptor [Sandaracinobacter sp. RS1-74]|uniref:TonB-dependent receptor n=1 Tax=Sandaracinobacteroides sayramensis TaxID=2913411 RepID=UPI001EDAE522|nr:TonB-dependent receptor [Sandaracinobacteroides sayramensis]MCG2842505.1 TonB-dependent receptor [Sandaracinobacteroides sayramensis]
MAASSLAEPGLLGGTGGRRSRSPFTFGRVLAAIGLLLVALLLWNLWGRVTVTERPNEVKMTTVVIPPPPPPPPPPEPEKVEQPPEPTPAPPIDQPVDTPPPPEPQQSSEPSTPGDNALTAREGAGPSNYGLAVGSGGGTRIGGRPGGSGDGFAAYGALAAREVQMAAQRDRELTKGSYRVRLAVTVDEEGRITHVRVVEGGDEKRNARLLQALMGLQLSRRPPPGLPVVNVELNARSGA